MSAQRNTSSGSGGGSGGDSSTPPPRSRLPTLAEHQQQQYHHHHHHHHQQQQQQQQLATPAPMAPTPAPALALALTGVRRLSGHLRALCATRPRLHATLAGDRWACVGGYVRVFACLCVYIYVCICVVGGWYLWPLWCVCVCATTGLSMCCVMNLIAMSICVLCGSFIDHRVDV